MSALNRDSRGRLRLFGLIGLLGLGMLLARLFYLQIVSYDRYVRLSREQHARRERIPPLRGRIVDRSGEQLAYSINNPTLVAETRKVNQSPDRADHMDQLVELTGQPREELEKKLKKRRRSVTLNERNPMTTDALKGLDIPGVRAEWVPKRIYPIGIAASTVTGFVNVDQAGTEGMEKAFQDDLRGAPGWSTYFRDGAGNLHPGQEKPAEPGNDLVLTIDSYLQQVAYQKLAEGVTRLNALNGWVLVIDVRTGDILAMANAPGYDPTFFERSDSELYRNHIISDVIEPGSTIKAITASAALEEGTRRPDTPVDCGGGRWNYLGRTISDHEGMGTVPFIDTFVHSSNVGMAKTGVALGSERMHHWLKQFGFGVKTGIPLEGEVKGNVVPLARWSKQTAASVAFGYEVQVTALQMAMAYAALANDGVLMKPRLVKEVRAPGGQVLSTIEPQAVRRVVSSGTARTMRDFMRQTVERGTGREAAVDWCMVGGKTGTAKKPDPVTHQYGYKHYSSFIGIAPVDSPRFLCYVVMNEPKGEIYGGKAAAPIFKAILDAAARAPHPILRPDWDVVAGGAGTSALSEFGNCMVKGALQVTPEAAAAETLLVADAGRARLAAAKKAAEKAKWLAEHPTVARQLARQKARADSILAARAAAGDSAALAILHPAPAPQPTGPAVPDMTGLTRREVQRRLAGLGLTARFTGSGVVLHQNPEPGARLKSSGDTPLFLLGDRAVLVAQKEKEAHAKS